MTPSGDGPRSSSGAGPSIRWKAADQFGRSVSIDGDTLVVGMPRGTSIGGAVYVFARDEGAPDGWGQVTKLAASDPADVRQFGHSVSIHDGSVGVGAYGHMGAGDLSGAAYLFRRDQSGPESWGQVARLTAFDAAAGDRFGWSVAVSGDTVVVGADLDDDNGTKSGSAYVFFVPEPSAWAMHAVALAVLAGLARRGRVGRRRYRD